jgi:hypothetical protein
MFPNAEFDAPMTLTPRPQAFTGTSTGTRMTLPEATQRARRGLDADTGLLVAVGQR